jgi:hypothetical protein
MAGCDAFDFEILGCVSGKLEYFGGKVFENGGEVDRGLSANARLLAGDVPEMAFYAAAGELGEGDEVSAFVLMSCYTRGQAGEDVVGCEDAMVTHLQPSFGRVRLGCFCVRVALSTRLATSFT